MKACPKCGSVDVASNRFVNTCGKCGHTARRFATVATENVSGQPEGYYSLGAGCFWKKSAAPCA